MIQRTIGYIGAVTYKRPDGEICQGYAYQDEDGFNITGEISRGDRWTTPQQALNFTKNVMDEMHTDGNMEGEPLELHALEKVVEIDMSPVATSKYVPEPDEDDEADELDSHLLFKLGEPLGAEEGCSEETYLGIVAEIELKFGSEALREFEDEVDREPDGRWFLSRAGDWRVVAREICLRVQRARGE